MKENKFIAIALGIILSFLLVWILILGRAIILPFMIAVLLSFILDPVVKLLRRWKLPTGIAVFITLIISFVAIYLLGLLVYASVEMFVDHFPAYKDRLVHSINSFSNDIERLLGTPLNINIWKKIDWLDTLQRFSVGQGVLSSVGTFVSFFAKMLIVILFIAYILTGKRNLHAKISRAFKKEQADRIIKVYDNVENQVQKYLGAKTLISFITGLISAIVFYLFGLDFAIFWGFLIFLFNFIPNIGSIVASVIPVLFSLLQFGSFPIAFWLLICMVLLQITMGNIIEPKLMGRSLNLSPMVVIMALIFWGYIWGVAGMILAVPILGTITILFENIESLQFISVFFRGKIKE